jgi:hypothetical protein
MTLLGFAQILRIDGRGKHDDGNIILDVIG